MELDKIIDDNKKIDAQMQAEDDLIEKALACDPNKLEFLKEKEEMEKKEKEKKSKKVKIIANVENFVSVYIKHMSFPILFFV